MFALRNLETGLFFCKGEWSMDSRIAQQFPDEESVKRVAKEIGLKKAEITFLTSDFEVIGGTFFSLE